MSQERMTGMRCGGWDNSSGRPEGWAGIPDRASGVCESPSQKEEPKSMWFGWGLTGEKQS